MTKIQKLKIMEAWLDGKTIRWARDLLGVVHTSVYPDSPIWDFEAYDYKVIETGTRIVVWPDYDWCYEEDLKDYSHKSDDYRIVEIETFVKLVADGDL